VDITFDRSDKWRQYPKEGSGDKSDRDLQALFGGAIW
jgi:hypothetical protein